MWEGLEEPVERYLDSVVSGVLGVWRSLWVPVDGAGCMFGQLDAGASSVGGQLSPGSSSVFIEASLEALQLLRSWSRRQSPGHDRLVPACRHRCSGGAVSRGDGARAPRPFSSHLTGEDREGESRSLGGLDSRHLPGGGQQVVGSPYLGRPFLPFLRACLRVSPVR